MFKIARLYRDKFDTGLDKMHVFLTDKIHRIISYIEDEDSIKDNEKGNVV